MANRKAKSENNTLRRQEIHKESKEFEEKVAEIFRFLGYTTILDYQRDALQFDVRLEMSGGPLPIHALVECKNTGKPVGQKQIREFATKVEHARRADVLPYQAILVSRSGFVNNAYEVARQQFVHLRTFGQLISLLVDFGPNLKSSIDAFHGTELKHLYVEQDVVTQREGRSEWRREGLTKAVLDWLNEPRNSFLALLGDFGAGKTSFCKRLACELAIRAQEQPGSARIPVLIDLRSSGSTTVTMENLLTHHFQSLSSQPLSLQSLLYLNREGHLVLLFDGFDEVIAYSEPSRYLDNLRQILRAAEGRAKVLLTCRTHYFRDQPEELRHLSSTSEVLTTVGATHLYDEISKRPGSETFYLQELTESQIDQYLEKAVPPPASWVELREQIRQTYNLRNLAERPFLLELIVKTLPRLQMNSARGSVTVADLYEAYCESWLNHSDFRLTLTRERRLSLVQHLARKLWNRPGQTVHYRDLFDDSTEFFCDRPLTPHEKDRIDYEVRTALFLRRDPEGHYSFIHRSFLEFFVARILREGLLAYDSNCLDGLPLTREVVFFLSHWPESERIPTLVGQILSGAYRPRISENALQLLAFHVRSQFGPLVGPKAEFHDSAHLLKSVRERFRTLRPENVHLDGARLSGADLRGVDLEGAHLKGVHLDGAQLQGASFVQAELTNSSLVLANAREALFTRASLSNTHLEHAHFEGADFCDADLTGADLSFASVPRHTAKAAPPLSIEAIEKGQQIFVGNNEGTRAVSRLARPVTFLLIDSRAELTVHQGVLPLGLERLPKGGLSPSSLSQLRTWFLCEMVPDVSPIRSLALRINGPLSIAALQRSVNEIVGRHEILRTTFHYIEGELMQQVSSERTYSVPTVDLRGIPAGMRRQVAQELTRDQGERLPDLACGPLFSVIILELDLEERIIVLAIHKLVADKYSHSLLTSELSTLYGAFLRGDRDLLPELVFQFRDIAAWQRLRCAKVTSTDLFHWREKLAGAPESLNLPTDRPRPVIPSRKGAYQRHHLSEDLAGPLRSFAGRHEATPLMVLLAAFKILLGHYSDSRDVVVGLSVHGRQYPVLEKSIGPLSDVRVLRTDLSDAPTFEGVLERVREGALAAFASELSFERLVEELRPLRDLSRTPIFQVLFSYRGTTFPLAFDHLTAALVEPEARVADFELSMEVIDSGQGLLIELTYTASLFDFTTISRMLTHLQVILEEVTMFPSVSPEETSLLLPSERHQAIVEWNDTSWRVPRFELCLNDLFAAQVRRTPDETAVEVGDQTLTYAELDRLAEEWALRLVDLGVRPEMRVAILLERSLSMVVSLLAIFKAGGAYVPLEPQFPQERLQLLLRKSGACILLTQKRLLELLPSLHVTTLLLDDPVPALGESVASRRHPHPDNLCYTIHTSGSTGVPKGVMVTHHGVVSFLHKMQAVHHLTAEDRVLQLSSINFDFSVQEIFWPLISGARLVIAQSYGSPDYLADFIAQYRITILTLTSSLATFLFQLPDVESKCATLRKIFVGGETLPAEAQKAITTRLGQSVGLYSAYGPTEATVSVTSCRLTGGINPGNIGRPGANLRIYVLNRQLQPVPVGLPGQLYVAGDQLARGYLGDPSLTAAYFIPDPLSTDYGGRLYASGDLVRYSMEGSIEFIGRANSPVKIRGFRIELKEIEAALRLHPQVIEAVVVVREVAPGDRRLVGYLIARGGPPNVNEIESFVREILPSYMVPAKFVFLSAFPLTPRGKVDQRALPNPAWDLDYAAPRDFVEQSLCEIWSEILGREKIGINDNFFELGGHSLIATQMILRIRKRFAVDLPLSKIFGHPTVKEIAKSVSRLRQAS